jgi:hypothetical protein
MSRDSGGDASDACGSPAGDLVPGLFARIERRLRRASASEEVPPALARLAQQLESLLEEHAALRRAVFARGHGGAARGLVEECLAGGELQPVVRCGSGRQGALSLDRFGFQLLKQASDGSPSGRRVRPNCRGRACRPTRLALSRRWG